MGVYLGSQADINSSRYGCFCNGIMHAAAACAVVECMQQLLVQSQNAPHVPDQPSDAALPVHAWIQMRTYL